MKAQEIREQSVQDIEVRLQEEQEDLRKLRFQHAIATLENPALLRTKRRTIARLKTILSEKQQAA